MAKNLRQKLAFAFADRRQGHRERLLWFGRVWIVGWSLVTLLFDAFLAYAICKQMSTYT